MLSTKDLVFKERSVKKVDREICEILFGGRSSVEECSETKAISLNEDISDGEY